MSGRILNLMVLFITATLILGSCLKEDPLNIDDGIYIKGTSIAFTSYDKKGMMKPALNEVNGQPREGLYEIFISVSSESGGFNIIEVNDNTRTKYGPATSENIALTGENGQITGTIRKGVFGPDAGVFTVPESGLYHIIIDNQTSTYVISPVSEISLYSHSAGEEWTETEIPLKGSFDKSIMIFETTGLHLAEGEYRFRYGHGDKIEVVGSEVKVHTSFGGIISGSMPSFELSMTPGGNNYLIGNEYQGTYTLDIFWSVGVSFAAQMTETGSSDFPEKLFMIGDGISTLTGEDAWNWDLNDYEMIPVQSKPNLFWKIVWLNNTGEIRFAPQKTNENDFGKEGEEVNGLYNIGEQNISVPGNKGYYMVAVNLLTEQIYIGEPEVYLIGDLVGSWDLQNTQGRFAIDNSYEILYIMKALKGGNLKMYAWLNNVDWFTYWWNAEFTVDNNEIKYAGSGTSLNNYYMPEGGYKISLNFKTGSGLIEKCTCST
jgi:hypothetical protein